MNYDLKITNGLIYNGDGTEPFLASIAIKDGMISEIGECEGEAHRTIDAKGLAVTPGFIDLHTHYDGQVSWDEEMQPSVNHGVTTVVLGSCGVGFAPVRPSDQDKLVRLMEGVEDIPGAALSEGIRWNWESLPEYMDALDAQPHTIDFAVQVTHDALRVYVMGERAIFDQQATQADIKEMRQLTSEALDAGAIGFTTGRSDLHRSADGEWTPSSEASSEELAGIAEAFANKKHGVLQAVNDFNLEHDGDHFDREFDILESFAKASNGRPFSLSLMQRDFAPDQWLRIIERAENAKDNGIDMHFQVAPRGIGVTLGLQCTFHPFMGFPSYKKISHLPLSERVKAMQDTQFKHQLLQEKPDKLAGDGTPIPPITDTLLAAIDFVASKTFLLGEKPDYEQSETTSVKAMATAKGIGPLEQMYDLMLENNGEALLYFPIYNYTEMSFDNVHTMMNHPQSIMGLSDGGAHVGTVCDASFPTYLMSYWTRDRKAKRIKTETTVNWLTAKLADYAGMHDRGRIQVGKKADINIIDLENLQLKAPRMVQDLPAGGQRLLQEAKGYVAVIVAGQPVIENDELTTARPGRLLRAS